MLLLAKCAAYTQSRALALHLLNSPLTVGPVLPCLVILPVIYLRANPSSCKLNYLKGIFGRFQMIPCDLTPLFRKFDSPRFSRNRSWLSGTHERTNVAWPRCRILPAQNSWELSTRAKDS
ncbi:hypothetical protein K438DRAFT_1827699 [Mycena galopus ATCC 62051]|nr:hypothetical protein K438DRAFT_1827699 [Mycena galopus ATCC 62051]